ncbi:MAG: hypothetical protein ACP5HS_00240 [Anaerolineae bacterium]
MKYQVWRIGLLLSLFVALLVTGCGQPAQEAETPVPTMTSAPTETEVPPEPTATPEEPTAEPAPTETSPPAMVYRRVEIPEAGLSFDMPEGWAQTEQDYVWLPEPGDKRAVGVAWLTIEPPQEPEAALLPSGSQTLESEEVAYAFGSGRRFLLEVYGTTEEGGEQAPVVAVEMHVLVIVEQGGDRVAYDFFASAPTREELDSIEPVLEHMLESAALEPVAGDPAAALRAKVAQELSVNPDQVRLTDLEETQWPDACLGLPAEDEMCAQVITPGYRATAEVGDRTYQVRADQDITRVILVPPAVFRAETILAEQLDVPTAEIRLVRYEYVEWSDACLGRETKGSACAQVITPGYRVIFEVDGQRYEVHTDATGQSVAILP